jgi:pyocin large subunit-like protein
MQRLEQDTGLDRKTILKIISELLADHLIQDTGERKGVTKRVKVYKLLGVTGRETVPTTEPFNRQKPPETVPSMEQSQQWNDSNNGMLNSPNSGTLNIGIQRQ